MLRLAIAVPLPLFEYSFEPSCVTVTDQAVFGFRASDELPPTSCVLVRILLPPLHLGLCLHHCYQIGCFNRHPCHNYKRPHLCYSIEARASGDALYRVLLGCSPSGSPQFRHARRLHYQNFAELCCRVSRRRHVSQSARMLSWVKYILIASCRLQLVSTCTFHYRPFRWTFSSTIATKSVVNIGTIATITSDLRWVILSVAAREYRPSVVDPKLGMTFKVDCTHFIYLSTLPTPFCGGTCPGILWSRQTKWPRSSSNAEKRYLPSDDHRCVHVVLPRELL